MRPTSCRTLVAAPRSTAQQASLQNFLTVLGQAQATNVAAVRRDRTTSALNAVSTAEAAFGIGRSYTLGTFDLML